MNVSTVELVDTKIELDDTKPQVNRNKEVVNLIGSSLISVLDSENTDFEDSAIYCVWE